ncbi:NAD(P)-dependent oxidoreductase [Pelagibacteraceae bacterium]|nr:NAD(P)-dependent oxidoreductase [Pelagibacteraceae bacterium]
MKDKKIGFIGLGNVGSKVAYNILQQNYYTLYIYDLNKKSTDKFVSEGAILCKSLEELVNNVTVFITCLPSPQDVKKVILHCLPFIKKYHLWIEMSTTDEEEMQMLSGLLIKKKAQVLEAPITGGQHKAESGNISILVGGSKKTFKRSFPILSCIGYKILHCGKIGNASTLKVVTNYLASINLLAIGEALMVCKKYGLDLKTSYKGIQISSGNSFVHETESQVILNGSYDVGFTMDLVCKDVGLFNKLIKKFKIPGKISNLMLKTFKKGERKFGKRSLSTSIVKLLEDDCGVNLRSKGFPRFLIDNNKKKKGIEVHND